MTGGVVGIGAVVAALISATVALLLWLANARREGRREARRRRERSLDVQKALRAEILAHAYPLQSDDLDVHLARMRALIGLEPGFFPFVPREAGTSVYHALITEVHLLPSDAVGPVVAYYTQADAVAKFADDLRDRRVARLAPDRRTALYEDFIAMKKVMLARATAAVAALDAGLPEPERRSGWER